MLGVTSSLLRYFVFLAAYLETPALHRYFVGKGRSLSTADLDSSEYFGGNITRIQSTVPDRIIVSLSNRGIVEDGSLLVCSAV
jgi:hypothetical protein